MLRIIENTANVCPAQQTQPPLSSHASPKPIEVCVTYASLVSLSQYPLRRRLYFSHWVVNYSASSDS